MCECVTGVSTEEVRDLSMGEKGVCQWATTGYLKFQGWEVVKSNFRDYAFLVQVMNDRSTIVPMQKFGKSISHCFPHQVPPYTSYTEAYLRSTVTYVKSGA